MNMFSRCNTLNDILEALVGDASDFLQRWFSIDRKKMAVGWLMGIIRLHDFWLTLN
jgi:hypothetical protein